LKRALLILTVGKTREKTDANGFNPVIGLNYFNHLTTKLSVTFGAQYSSIGNLDYGSRTSKITRFRMGEESHVTVITPIKLHYLVAPIKLNYALNSKNTIGLGCNISYC